MFLTAIKIKLAAMLVVAGIDMDELKTMSPELRMTLDQLAKDQEDTSKDLNAVMTAAVTKVSELAKQGDPDANYAMGRWAVTGVIPNVDLETTLSFYRAASEKGQVPAKSELGQILFQAYPQDNTKIGEAVKLIQDAEAAGDRTARRVLANLHLNGVANIEKNPEKARDLLLQGSTAGDGEATYMLFQLYTSGVTGSILKDDKKALDYLKQATEQGNAVAMSTLGARMFNGDQPTAGGVALVEKNPEKALEMFEKAAEKGNAAAYRLLATIYEEGLGGQKKDLKKAVELYAKAASGRDAEALFRMGVASELGWTHPDSKEELVQKNPKNALDLYRLAAQNGDVRATYNVGVYYEAGNVVDRDLEKAFGLFKRAADAGVREAMQKVGMFYQNGQGVGQDLVAAKAWFEAGSNANFAPSQLSLGAMYEMGAGVRANPTAAANQYSLAADQGMPLAMLRLASMYERGVATTKNEPDLVRAWSFAKQAVEASEGTEIAVNYLEALEKQMKPEQITEAKKIFEQRKAAADAEKKNAETGTGTK